MTVVRYGRATATNPGKHGPRDWRVDFNGESPTHAELVWMASYFMLAEDRYTAGDKRERLWWFLERAHDMTDNHAETLALAHRVQQAVDNPASFTLPRKRRTNGKDDWLCTECRGRPKVRDDMCGWCWLETWATEEAEIVIASAGQDADRRRDVTRT